MNATDQREYIVKGFRDLIERLERGDKDSESARRIRTNTAAREAAIDRVRNEYAFEGLEPPSDLALSITARREFGIGVIVEAGSAADANAA